MFAGWEINGEISTAVRSTGTNGVHAIASLTSRALSDLADPVAVERGEPAAIFRGQQGINGIDDFHE
ncbi:MAG: hypothetical protein ABT11_07235 [Novosphingobium sp. SCN 66-18]|nr:MAG: hypothetical protein ABT11_07235 [Novosphingobium sp. SCN 66-18]